jgi:hypothetical protein
MKRVLLNAAVAAALVSAGAAHAAATQVNFGFVPFGSIDYVGTSLGTSTALDFDGATFMTNTVGMDPPVADNSGVFSGMAVDLSLSVINYSIGSTTVIDFMKSFTTGPGGAAGSAGLYTAAFTSVTAQSIGPDFVNLIFAGTLSGPDGYAAADVMLLNCNQSGGQTAAVNCSFTEQGPPVSLSLQVPEPATMSLVGLSLFGLMAAGRRRRPR